MDQKIDRLPPHSTEAEQGVLGCVLLSPNYNLGKCIERFKAVADMFYDLRHQAIYQAMTDMFEEKKPIDFITLQQTLKDRQQLESVGGMAYLTSLPDNVPSAGMIDYYIEILIEKSLLRTAVRLFSTGTDKAFSCKIGAVDLLTVSGKELFEAVAGFQKVSDVPIKKTVQDVIAEIEDEFNRGTFSGIATGFADLDAAMNGLQPGEVTIIAGRPSQGKTTVAMNIVEHIAVERAEPVTVFSLEMSRNALVKRMLSCNSRVDLKSLRESDFDKMVLSVSKISKSRLKIIDATPLTVGKMQAVARREAAENSCGLFVIDYLQLMQMPASERREREVAEASFAIKNLARELNSHFIVISQLNREQEKDKNRMPRLCDLRESGSLEQDADNVLMIWKPDESNDAGVGEPHLVNLVVAKQRNGPRNFLVPLTFFPRYTRFENAPKIQHKDIPEGSRRYAD